MSLVSEQQLLQNQLQLKQLDEQRIKQAEQTRSFQSNRSSTQEVLHNLRQKEREKAARKDPSDPLAVLIPTDANPTDVLASRFGLWRTIVASLLHYLKEIVSVHEEISRQQIRLHHAITFPFMTQGLDGEYYQPVRVNASSTGGGPGLFSSGHKDGSSSADLSKQNVEFEIAQKLFLPLGNGSIQDLPTVLYQYHSNAALLAQAAVKELNGSVIPRLEDLKRDLLVKIKEIKSLQSDFKNQVNAYQQETKVLLSAYSRAIDTSKHNPSELQPKDDPYLLRIGLNRIIKKKLTEENYLHEAFNNLQTSAKELEKVVYIEIQTALTVYAKLLGQQAQNVFDGLISKLDSGLLTKDPAFEWEAFVTKDTKNFIDLNLPMRHMSEIRYNFQNDPLSFEIRSGYLERKSKFLKSYSKGWYVLTPSFIHEFKSSDRKKDPVPLMSLALEDCQLAEHSRKDEKNPNSYHKFVLHAKQNGLLRKGHNWVFRAENYDLMMSWYSDIKKLTGMTNPQARSALGWERKKQERLSSLASSSVISNSTSVKNRRTTQLSNITDQSSFHRVSTQSPSVSLTNKSLDTVLSLPKNTSNTLSPSELGSSQIASSMVTDEGVVSVPDETTRPIHHHVRSDDELVHADVGTKRFSNNMSKRDSFITLDSNTKDGHVDEMNDRFADVTLSDESKKETQM